MPYDKFVPTYLGRSKGLCSQGKIISGLSNFKEYYIKKKKGKSK